MTKRRKPVACALCGKDTLNDNGVCSDCLRVYNAGRDALALKAEGDGEFEIIQMPHGLRLHGERVTFEDRMRRESALVGEIGKLILAVAGATPANSWGDGDPIRIDPIHQEFAYGCEAYAVPTGRAKPIEELIRAISAYVGMRETKAFEEGNSILMRLASGEVGLTEANEYTARQRGRRRD